MSIFFLEWNSLCNEDIKENFIACGKDVYSIDFVDDTIKQKSIKSLLLEGKMQKKCEFVFTFNYYPEVSKACSELGLKYVSWVYDNPHIQAYSYTVINECNYIFLFDYSMYAGLKQVGINTVYYMPLAINTLRMERLDKEEYKEKREIYTSDISFVGSLYSEKKHDIYSKFNTMPDYAKGYLDGLINAQKNVAGYNFLEEMLSDDILLEMQKVYPTNPNAETVLSDKALYADYVLARKVTAMERGEIIGRIGDTFGESKKVALYTHDKKVNFSGVKNDGLVDYYDQMPYVFRNSKINLNITLRSIKTGIPLRVLDILGNGGFLLTNYQEELFNYFEPGVDFVYYENIDDCLSKIDYYLCNDLEREKIANSGMIKARKLFDYREKIEQILEIVG